MDKATVPAAIPGLASPSKHLLRHLGCHLVVLCLAQAKNKHVFPR